MLIGLKGLVIKAVPVAQNDILLTLFTNEKGRITVCAKGARSLKSKFIAVSQMFCYAEFVLYERGGYYWVREGMLIENFYDIRSDIVKMSLASYLCDIVGDATYENMCDDELLRLILNSLYAISNDLKPLSQIKATFELRCALVLGYMPGLDGCERCGAKSDKDFCLDVMGGQIVCSTCREKVVASTLMLHEYSNENDSIRAASLMLHISPTLLAAMRYITSCAPDKIFSYAIPDDEMKSLSSVCETYLLNHVERSFSTLTFYKTVSAM